MEIKESEDRVEKNRNVMNLIWSSIPKEVGFSEETIKYVPTDLIFLYQTGFVDTNLFTLEEWQAAFQHLQQADSNYLITKNEFIKLGKFKYTGNIKAPVDPLKIREGWYEINDWRLFLIRSILPSTTALNAEFLKKGEENAKAKGLIVNGRIKIGKEIKLWLKQILDQHPTPQRLRELGVEKAHQERLKQEVSRSTSPTTQKTTFAKGQKITDVKKKNLDEMLVKRSSIKGSEQTKETISLKDLKKSSVKRPQK